MNTPVVVVGSYLSPYVRKVLVCLDLKGVPYEIDPIVPFFGNDDFARLSPVRRVPLLLDGDLARPDSTVICEYLEDRHPEPPLLPKAPAERARARWLEEYADTRMGEVFIWRLFNELVIRRFVWGAATDESVVRFARYTVDAARWPQTAAFVARVLDHPAFVKLRPFEELLLRTPIAKHRDALREAGAPVSAATFGTTTPRRGLLAT